MIKFLTAKASIIQCDDVIEEELGDVEPENNDFLLYEIAHTEGLGDETTAGSSSKAD